MTAHQPPDLLVLFAPTPFAPPPAATHVAAAQATSRAIQFISRALNREQRSARASVNGEEIAMLHRSIDVMSEPRRVAPELRRVASVLMLTAALAASTARGTVLTFDGLGTNVSLQDPARGAAVANCGSHVSGAGTGVQQGNGYTPNVAVLFTPDGGNTGGGSGSGGDGWQAYNDSEWSVAQLDGVPPDSNFDIVFTPDAGYGVTVNSFVFDDYAAYQAGHTFDWQLLDAGNTALFGASGVVVAADQNLTVNTGMTEPHFGTLTLRIHPTAGAVDDRGIDTINFNQAVPEPASCGVVAVALCVLSLGRKRRRHPAV
jgi:hypothetical protein